MFLPSPDSLIKGQTSTIYYYGADGYRYVFPNEKAFGSWFSDFGNVITISNEELGKIPLKGNVTYRPGVRLVKIQSVPKVYAIGKGGKLRWIKTEDLAKKLYGDDWNRKIDDIPDVFFVNYQEGDPIENETDYNATTVAEEVKTINKDRGIAESASAPKATSHVGDLTLPVIPAFPDQPASSTTSTIPFALPIPTPFVLPISATSTIPAIPALPAQPASLATSTPFVLPTSTTSTPALPAIPAIPAVPAQPISSNTSTPSVTSTPSTTGISGRLVVITPNGGEQLTTGSTYTIQWVNPLTGGFAGDKNMGLSINIYRTGDGVWSIGTVLPTTQTSYQWTISSSMPDASNYYARVCLVKNWLYADSPFLEPTAILPNHLSMPSGACVGDESDATFTISAPVATSAPIIPATSATSTPALDTTPPTISSVGAASITETGATINWTTNEASDSSVQYGTSQSYGQTSQNTSSVTFHTLNLTGLSANTTYHYKVTSKDVSGNLAAREDGTFITQSPPPVSSNIPSGATVAPDGTWCYDSDGNGGYKTKGYCQDNTGTYTDYCSSNVARDYYCSGTYGTSGLPNDYTSVLKTIKCDNGGYTCTMSLGDACYDGACVFTTTSSTVYKQNNFRMLVLSMGAVFLASITLIAWRLKFKKL